MDRAAFAQVATSFATCHQTFAPLFRRKEVQQRSEQYLRGLLVQQTDRRNAENVAEAIEGATPRALQRLLTEAQWDDGPVISALQRYLAPRLNAPDGVFVLDGTGFPKQGTKSVGVARQYCGTLGKIGNCQLGVFLAYASDRGHALVDKRLYLPQRWTDDRTRGAAAGVPDAVPYQSQTDLALAMLRQARRDGHLTGRWVTADEDFGKVPSFRDALDTEGWHYMLEVPCTIQVFTAPAETTVPAWTGQGRRPTRPRLTAASPSPQAVAAVAAALASDAWQVLAVAEGAQGPRHYQCAALRVWESRDGLPGRACWLVLRRNLDGSELKYYLSNAPAGTPLVTLAQVGARRWSIETAFQTGKGETGLDEYEVRSWQGWHRHITLALLAGAFLLTVQQDWGEKGACRHAPAGNARAARASAPAHVDRGRPARLARRYPAAQRPRQTLPHQTALTHAH